MTPYVTLAVRDVIIVVGDNGSVPLEPPFSCQLSGHNRPYKYRGKRTHINTEIEDLCSTTGRSTLGLRGQTGERKDCHEF